MQVTTHSRFTQHLRQKLTRLVAAVLLFTLVVLLSFSHSAIAGPDDTTTNKALAMKFAKAGWGTEAKWESVWDELMRPDVVHHFNSSAAPIVGRTANKEFNRSLFEGFPDIHQDIADVIAEGDKVVYRSTISGTNTGVFLGLPPTGKTSKTNDFTLLRFEDGKIAEWWYETNLLEAMQQLGIIDN